MSDLTQGAIVFFCMTGGLLFLVLLVLAALALLAAFDDYDDPDEEPGDEQPIRS
ncbi:hypothetical protein [Marinobacterium litorale]|uniref:hypothetical protein n=1 Tax=Marinobacterium litorale TaxID=404770 RepID=UPI0003FF8F16|nr:hypothetical protein [Marinobacterium litorale]